MSACPYDDPACPCVDGDARNLSYVLEHRGVGWEADARHLFEAADRAEGVTHE